METNLTVFPDTAPDWSAVPDEIDCPLCRYNLRGLSESRCPECGYRFTWPEVLDPGRRDHPFLFEHHFGRWCVSFFKTLWAGWHAERFWTSLHPAQRVYSGRLAVYYFFVLLPWLVGLIAAPILASGQVPEEFFLITALALGWQWLIFAGLQIFRWSMRRARVSTGHVLRCVVYSYDLLFWVGLLAAAWVAIVFACDALFSGGPFLWGAMMPSQITIQVIQIGAVGVVASVSIGHLLALWRLYRAYSLYMRFDRVGATLTCVVLIALMVVINLALVPFWF